MISSRSYSLTYYFESLFWMCVFFFMRSFLTWNWNAIYVRMDCVCVCSLCMEGDFTVVLLFHLSESWKLKCLYRTYDNQWNVKRRMICSAIQLNCVLYSLFFVLLEYLLSRLYTWPPLILHSVDTVNLVCKKREQKMYYRTLWYILSGIKASTHIAMIRFTITTASIR